MHLEAGNIALNSNIVLNNGNFTATTPGQLTQADNAGVYTGSGSLNINGAGGVQMQQIVGGGEVRLTSTGGRVIVNTPIISLDNVGAVGNVALLAANGAAGVTLNGALAGPGGINVTSSAGNITTGVPRLESTGPVSLNAGGRLDVGTGGIKVTTAANVDLTGTQAVRAIGPVATDGAIITITSEGDVTMNQLASRLSANAPSGAVDIKSKGGNVVLAGELGGPNTGYTNFDVGYQRSLRPDVGRLTISAGKSVETNGLNIDGNDSESAAGNGLQIIAGGRLIVNNQIAVNKGDILLESTGTADTDGVYIGNNVYSRGYDLVTTGSRPTDGATRYINAGKTAYAITIRAAKNIALFDNTNERADFTTETFVARPICADNPVFGCVVVPPPAYAYSLAKIIVSNNAANYSSNELNSLIQPNNFQPFAKLTLVGSLTGIKQPAQTPLRVTDANITLAPMAATPNITNLPGRSPVASEGIMLKLLAYRSSVDVPTYAVSDERCDPYCSFFPNKLEPNIEFRFDNVGALSSPGKVDAVDVSRLRYLGPSPSLPPEVGTDISAITSPPYRIVSDGTLPNQKAPSAIYKSLVDIPVETYVRTPDGYLAKNYDGSLIPDGMVERISGTRLILYDGIVSRSRGRIRSDEGIPVGNTTGNFNAANNTTSSFSQIGGFGTVSAPAIPSQPPPPPPPLAPITPPVSGPSNNVSEQPPLENQFVTTVERETQTSEWIAVDKIAVGMRPAADADLGRSSSLGGSARNVFATRYRIARTTDATLCVPDDIESAPATSASGTVGNDEKRCR